MLENATISFGEVITVLGGYTLVVGGLFSVLARIWVLRLVEREKFSLQRQLDETNRSLQAELDRKLHIGKTQFDREFSCYQSIWACLVDLRNSTLQIRPTLDFIDPDENKEQRRKRRITKFSEHYNLLQEQIHKNRPFYSASVYDSLCEVVKLCHEEAVDADFVERTQREYWQESRENHKKIVAAIDACCEAIRSRISAVEVVP